MTKHFLIGNISLLLKDTENCLCLESVWGKFAVCPTEKFNCKIEIMSAEKFSYGIQEYKIGQRDSRIICFRHKGDVIITDENWREVFILPLIVADNFHVFTNQIFYAHAVQRSMIQIHSSMVDYQGQGILFLGPSGIGKTTQAELWNQYCDALIINGDMNFVQKTEDGFLGWGTPWHGSSPYCENAKVRVCALVVLGQDLKNTIRILKGLEKTQRVMDCIIYPDWVERGMELCLETLNELLNSIPVYLLQCRPDEEAVLLTKKAVIEGIYD